MTERTFTRQGASCSPPWPNDRRSQLQRRQEAARRLPPLDCGCHDPWPCRCTEPPISDRVIDGWADAARYVLETSCKTPIVPLEVLRALWRRGGEDRTLAEDLYARLGVVA